MIKKLTGIVALLAFSAAGAVRAQENYTVHMADSVNKLTAELSVISVVLPDSTTEIVVHNMEVGKPGSGDLVKVRSRNMNTPIETDAGVPGITPAEILNRYSCEVKELIASGKFVSDNGQLTWTLPKSSSFGKPTELELALAMFLVDEWFYFG